MEKRTGYNSERSNN